MRRDRRIPPLFHLPQRQFDPQVQLVQVQRGLLQPFDSGLVVMVGLL